MGSTSHAVLFVVKVDLVNSLPDPPTKAISAMNERAHALQDNASQFELSAGKMKNKFWMENVKYLVLILVLVAVVGLALYLLFRPWGAGFAYLSPAEGTGT